MDSPQPTSHPFIRQRATGPHWYAKWSRGGRPVIRALGRAWVEPDGSGGWRRRRGRAPEGTLTEPEAAARMLELVRAHHADQAALESDDRERRRRGVTFRELTADWLEYLEFEKGVKASTLRNYGWQLAEPGTPHLRGSGTATGLLMKTFGDRRAREITVRDVADYLRRLDRSGATPRTVNRHRQVISAIFGYAMREDTHGMALNPASATTRRREPPPAVLDFYEPDEVEAIARALEQGLHRHVTKLQIDDEERAAREAEDRQDAEIVRVAAYTGVRLGELRALRWRDVNLAERRLVVERAFSDTSEGPTKSWQTRYLPLADPAAAALARLALRPDFTHQADFVFCNRLGRPLDGSAIRRRYQRAAAAAGLRVLRFHDLRHGAGSIAARHADARWVQAFLGHSKLTTTERYLHAKARPEDADICPEWSVDNLARLAEALTELSARLKIEEGSIDTLAVEIDARTIRQLEIGTWRTSAGDIDVLLGIPGATRSQLARYEQLAEHATLLEIDTLHILVASLDSIIRSKEIAGRPKDREALIELRTLRDR